MHFTKVQISELMRKHAEKENDLHDLMEIMLESMMVAERSEFLHENPQNKGKNFSFLSCAYVYLHDKSDMADIISSHR